MNADITCNATITLGRCYAVTDDPRIGSLHKYDYEEDSYIDIIYDWKTFSLPDSRHVIFGNDGVSWSLEKDYSTITVIEEGRSCKLKVDVLIAVADRAKSAAIMLVLHSGGDQYYAAQLTADDIIHISKSFYGAPKQEPKKKLGIVVDHDHTMTIQELFDQVVEQFIQKDKLGSIEGANCEPISFKCIEIRSVKEFSRKCENCGEQTQLDHACMDGHYGKNNPCAVSLLETYPKHFYGILSCDEAWRFVPPHVAKERLSKYWHTRKFVAIVPFDTSVLALNLRSKEYDNHQRSLAHRYNITTNNCFVTNSPIACLDHGGFLLILDTLFRLSRATYLKNKFNEVYGSEKKRKCRDGLGWKKLNHLHRQLSNFHKLIEIENISELDELEGKIARAVHLNEYTESTRSLIETINIQLIKEKETAQFWLMTVIAVLGVIFTLTQTAKLFMPNAMMVDDSRHGLELSSDIAQPLNIVTNTIQASDLAPLKEQVVLLKPRK